MTVLFQIENKAFVIMIAVAIILLVTLVICIIPSSAKAESSAVNVANDTHESSTDNSESVSSDKPNQTNDSNSSNSISLFWEQDKLTDQQIAGFAACLNIQTLRPYIYNLSGQEIINAVRNIEIVGRVLDNSAHYDLSLSGLSVSVLLNYTMEFLPDNVRRTVVAMWKSMLPENDRNVEAVGSLFGCSKNTIYAGINDIMQNGLAFNSDEPNKSGAGRPGTIESFGDAVLPVCVGAGIDEESVLKRHNLNVAGPVISEHLPELKSEDSGNDPENAIPENYSQPECEDGAVISEDTCEKEQPDPVTTENVLERLHTVHADVSTVLKALEAEPFRGRHAPIMFYRDFSNNVTIQVTRLLQTYGKLEKISAEACAITLHPVSIDQKSAESETGMARINFRTNVVLSCMVPLVQTLEDLLKNAQCVLAKNGTLSPYYIGKEMKRTSHLKEFSRKMDNFWARYHYVMKAIDDIKNDFSALNHPQKIELPEHPAHLDAHYEEAEKLLNELRHLLAEEHAAIPNKTIADALVFLSELQKKMEKVYTDECMSESKGILYALSNIVETVRIACQEWLNLRSSDSSTHYVATTISRNVLSSGFQDTCKRIFNELEAVQHAVNDAQNAAGDSKDTTEKPASEPEQNTSVSSEISESELNAVLEEYQSLRVLWTALKDVIRQGTQNMKPRKNTDTEADKERIQQAVQVLNEIMTHLEGIVPEANRCTVSRMTAFQNTVRQIYDKFEKWLSKWEKTDNGYKPSFSVSKQVSNSILAPRHMDMIQAIWKMYERTVRTDTSWSNNSGISDDYVQIENPLDKTVVDYLAPEQRAAIALKLWNEGKDPLDITAWIEFIICAECRDHYAEPDGATKCCRITKLELKEAFYLLTGLKYSETTLWGILTGVMGYSGRQCAKLDQIGEKDPQTDEQYQYIKQQMSAVDEKTTLILSIDTKSFVVLGKLKHDNGTLMCSPDGKVFRVYDHDFPMFMHEIYPNGTKLVDSERLKERAVLHPVGVYCPSDNSGYVALVLGKDTAESMANLIHTVINIKRETMPDLKKVLIMADGGGANTANGILWTEALLKLTEETGIIASTVHFPAGNSRHNIIERALWSYCTIHCKGKPFLDIEHVAHLFNETTTKTIKPLKVTCWFDRKKYKTLAEKKADGEPVLTRAQLDKMAQGRIYHPFDNSTSMYKWNYTVYPSAEHAKAASAAA